MEQVYNSTYPPYQPPRTELKAGVICFLQHNIIEGCLQVAFYAFLDTAISLTTISATLLAISIATMVISYIAPSTSVA